MGLAWKKVLCANLGELNHPKPPWWIRHCNQPGERWETKARFRWTHYAQRSWTELQWTSMKAWSHWFDRSIRCLDEKQQKEDLPKDTCLILILQLTRSSHILFPSDTLWLLLHRPLLLLEWRFLFCIVLIRYLLQALRLPNLIVFCLRQEKQAAAPMFVLK